MRIDDALYNAALELLGQHPETAVAACYLEDGTILTGIATDSFHDQVSLCAEAGPICEAQKLKQRIVASLCLSNSTKLGKLVVNAPCGICQERLFWFGGDIEVAIPSENGDTKWDAVTLNQLQPHWWYASRLAAKNSKS